jgi:hypothetical protein
LHACSSGRWPHQVARRIADGAPQDCATAAAGAGCISRSGRWLHQVARRMHDGALHHCTLQQLALTASD